MEAKRPVQLAGLAHLADHLGVGGAAGQVDERQGQLLGGVRGGALVRRPEELLRDVGLAAQTGGVEEHAAGDVSLEGRPGSRAVAAAAPRKKKQRREEARACISFFSRD
ncbi:hypothetical protein C2845_PM03G29590 [Panicum miliaceum]|uniref:Uncharacterized protein n=1 Tax=Panicum miliaceum TaxID=4540 RepID=A0A3L6TFY4_PANMI|nr:hypothetical protein C2845_PM03G29590 [Panicum miliaceum]